MYRELGAEGQKAVLSTTSVPAPLPSVLLNKTGYEMATHPAESTDWINVLFAQVSNLHFFGGFHELKGRSCKDIEMTCSRMVVRRERGRGLRSG